MPHHICKREITCLLSICMCKLMDDINHFQTQDLKGLSASLYHQLYYILQGQETQSNMILCAYFCVLTNSYKHVDLEAK